MIRSFAKINWLLRVLGRRADGYHELETLFQTISLHDELYFTEARELSLTCNDPSIPTGDENLVMRAARMMRDRLGAPAVSIELVKRVPAGGGLAGGSSNAAATLRAIDSMFAMNTPPETLRGFALELGSDVPFFLCGGAAIGRGRGEVLTPLPDPPALPLLLVLPEERMLTPDAFRALAALRAEARQPERTSLTKEEAQEIAAEPLMHRSLLVNDLEAPVFAMLPRLRSWLERLQDLGAGWSGMSGSGSTLIGMFESAGERDAAVEELSREIRCVAVEPVSRSSSLELAGLGTSR